MGKLLHLCEELNYHGFKKNFLRRWGFFIVFYPFMFLQPVILHLSLSHRIPKLLRYCITKDINKFKIFFDITLYSYIELDIRASSIFLKITFTP